jgi:MinD superfamily P-loop ATPase
MTTIAVASGKGGAGKTSISAALAAHMGPKCIFVDCDVDAANGAIALGAEIQEREPYYAGPGFSIDESACAGCGLCAQVCRFKAIHKEKATGTYRIIPELCERCGACFDRCPQKAVITREKQAGELFVSRTRLGIPLVHADLEPGEDTSGKLVRRVRERAEGLAEESSILVVDSPPGIGCPVIASLSGTDLVLVVIEASASGIRDAGRLVELAASMKRPAIALLNKTGLDAAADEKARALASRAGLPMAGEIPFDPVLRSAEEAGVTWMDIENETGLRIASAMNAVKGTVLSMERRKAEQNSQPHKERKE